MVMLNDEDDKTEKVTGNSQMIDSKEPQQITDFGTLSRKDLALLLGATNQSTLPLESKQGVDIYQCPAPATIRLPPSEIRERWVYQEESGAFESVPSASKWIIRWLFEKKLIPPCFAPVVGNSACPPGASGRVRKSKLLNRVRSLCRGPFKDNADFWSSFKCAWSNCSLHPCPSVLYIVGCIHRDMQAKNETLETEESSSDIEVQCVWTTGCAHHQSSKDRGYVRQAIIRELASSAITPRGLCHNTVREADAVAIAAGNRTFGPLDTVSSRQAQHRLRTASYKHHKNQIANIAILANETAEKDLREDLSRSRPFHGTVHDLKVSNSGEFSSVSIYNSLSVHILANELRTNKEAVVLVDCTGELVKPVKLSPASDMVRRSLASAKEKKPADSDGYMSFDPLVFHVAINLVTGTYVALEAIHIERTGQLFEDVLTGLRRRLSFHGPDAENIRYFVSDMAIPFALAITKVFNQMTIPEYMAIILFSAKRNKPEESSRHIKTRLVWCGVHGDRAIRNYAREAFKRHKQQHQNQMIWFFRNVRLALVSAKSYRELCLLVGFLDQFAGTKEFPILSHHEKNVHEVVVPEDQLFCEGESLLWNGLGDVPLDSDEMCTIRARACAKKGYNPTWFEHSHGLRSDDALPSKGKDRVLDDESNCSQLPLQSPEETKKLLGAINGDKEGIITLTYGPFHVYSVCREAESGRYRIYIPALSLFPGTIGGFECFVSKFKHRTSVANASYIEGKLRTYLRNQFYPNLAMFCPLLTGNVPLSHNTPVELSFKIKKHHTDTGVKARQMPGKMELDLYLSLAANEFRKEAVRIAAELASIQRQRRRQDAALRQRLKRTKANSGKVATLSSLAENNNPVVANDVFIQNVFIRKKKDLETPTVLSADNDEVQDIPETQQSVKDISAAEETWQKRGKRGVKTEAMEGNFRESFKEAKENYFTDWTDVRIAAFLTDTVLISIGRKLDNSAISRILNGKRLPGRHVIERLQTYFKVELVKQTVYIDSDRRGFGLLPGCVSRLHTLIESLRSTDDDNGTLCNIGDAQITKEDMKRLLRPEQVSPSEENQYWISDEVINCMTGLYSLEASRKTFFLFNSLNVKEIYDRYHCVGRGSKSSKQVNDEHLARMANRLVTIGRRSQGLPLANASQAYAPCHVNGNHWIGIHIDIEKKTLKSFDSMRRQSESVHPGIQMHVAALMGFMELCKESVDTNEGWEFKGNDNDLPQQENIMDCGIFTIAVARSLVMQDIFMIDSGSASLWRRRFAHEILVGEAT